MVGTNKLVRLGETYINILIASQIIYTKKQWIYNTGPTSVLMSQCAKFKLHHELRQYNSGLESAGEEVSAQPQGLQCQYPTMLQISRD